MPRVCVVAPLYHPSLGGVGRQALLLTRALAKEGAPLFVLTRRMRGASGPHEPEDPPLHRLWALDPNRPILESLSPRNLAISLSFCASLVLSLARLRRIYDIVHFHGASLPLLVSLPLLWLCHKPVLAKVAAAGLGTECGSLRGRHWGLGALLARYCASRVDAFVATTEEIARGLRADGVQPGRIVRAPNAVDLGWVRSIAGCARLRSQGEGPRVLFVGRLERRKGVEVLLEAWAEVSRLHPSAKLRLAGSGALESRLRQKAVALGVEGTVLFLGHVHGIASELAAANLVVHPSLQEGFSNALLEALAAGVPVVASAIESTLEITGGEDTAFLVPPDDADALARAIAAALDDPDEASRRGERGAVHVRSAFTLEAVVPRYLKLYRMLANE